MVYVVSPCSPPDSDPSRDILDLADVADVFVANSVRRLLPVIHLKILTSIVHFHCRRLIMVVSALVSMAWVITGFTQVLCTLVLLLKAPNVLVSPNYITQVARHPLRSASSALPKISIYGGVC